MSCNKPDSLVFSGDELWWVNGLPRVPAPRPPPPITGDEGIKFPSLVADDTNDPDPSFLTIAVASESKGCVGQRVDPRVDEGCVGGSHQPELRPLFDYPSRHDRIHKWERKNI